MPLVRIILPTFNRAKYLPEALNTVLEQTFQDFELIIADDGSTDETLEAVRPFVEKDPRISYRKYDHIGVAAVRNKAIGLSGKSFKYVAFIDSDDLWLPHHLEESAKVMENDDSVGFVFSRVETVDHTGRWKSNNLSVREARMRWPIENASRISEDGAYIIEPVRSFRALLRSEIAPIPSAVLIRAASVKTHYWFDENQEALSDLEFFVRYSSHLVTFGYLDSVHTKMRYFGDNITGLTDLSLPKFISRNLSVLRYQKKKLQLCFSEEDRSLIAKEIANQAYLLAEAYFVQKRRLKALKLYFESSYPALKGIVKCFIPSAVLQHMRKAQRERGWNN